MSILEEARAYAASLAIKDPMESVTKEEWDEWVQVSIALRAQKTRTDKHGNPQPMTWDQVVEWVRQKYPNAGRYDRKTLRARLITKTTKFLGTTKPRTPKP